MRWQWLEERAPHDPWFHMAADLAMFEALQADKMRLPSVRVYQWDRAVVSIGRLQEAAPVREAYPGLPLVRRPTGGQAVMHGQDLTISVVTRSAWLSVADFGVLSSYRLIASGVVEALSMMGIPAHLGHAAGVRPSYLPVRCFDMTARCDISELTTGRKLVGSAQRRENGVILQQMSIPLDERYDAGRLRQCLKSGLLHALAVSEWRSVDTVFAL